MSRTSPVGLLPRRDATNASELRFGFLAESFGKFSSSWFLCCNALIKHVGYRPLSFTGPFGPGTVRTFAGVIPTDPSLDPVQRDRQLLLIRFSCGSYVLC